MSRLKPGDLVRVKPTADPDDRWLRRYDGRIGRVAEAKMERPIVDITEGFVPRLGPPMPHVLVHFPDGDERWFFGHECRRAGKAEAQRGNPFPVVAREAAAVA